MILIDEKGAKYRVPTVDRNLINLSNEIYSHCGFNAGLFMEGSQLERDIDAQIKEADEFQDALKNGKSLERWRIG